MTVTVYTFEDKDGNKHDTFHTQDYKEAREYARTGELKVIANEYEWADSEVVDDYTGNPSDEAMEAIKRLTREQIVTLLEEQGGIQCYDNESHETLTEALRVNVGDGTIHEAWVLELAED